MKITPLIVQLDHELLPLGFKRKKSTWNRLDGTLVQVVNIQVSKSREFVTLNVGVLCRETYLLYWERDSEAFVDEVHCTVRARIGELKGSTDTWWQIDAPSTGEQLMECVRSSILPFFGRLRSLEELQNWLGSVGAPSHRKPLESIYYALLSFQMDDFASACEALALLNTDALKAWRSKAKEISIRIGCAC